MITFSWTCPILLMTSARNDSNIRFIQGSQSLPQFIDPLTLDDLDMTLTSWIEHCGQTRQPERRVEYAAPADEAISIFARSICGQLAENGDPHCANLEIVNGLTDFLKLAGRIQAKYLNRSQVVDSGDES